MLHINVSVLEREGVDPFDTAYYYFKGGGKSLQITRKLWLKVSAAAAELGYLKLRMSKEEFLDCLHRVSARETKKPEVDLVDLILEGKE